MDKKSTKKTLLQYGCWLFVLHTLIIIPISFLYYQNIELRFDFLTYFYLTILTFSHFSFLLLILFFIFYFPFVFIIKNKKALQILSISILSISIFILLMDVQIFKLYRFHINSFTLNLLFGGNGLEIFEFHSSIYLLGAFLFLLIVIVEYFTLKLYNKLFKKGVFKKTYLLIASILILMISSHLIHAWAHAAAYKPITKSSRLYPLYFPLTATKFMYKYKLADKKNSKYNVQSHISDGNKTLSYPKHKITFSDTTNKPNILFIIIDSWHYNSNNYNTLDTITTPNIFNFSKNASVYTNHSSGSNGTRTGIFSLFYSLPGIYWYDFLSARKSPVFIDELINRNYKFGIFASASLNNPEFDKTVFVNVNNLRTNSEGNNSNERDINITNEWLKYIDKHNSEDSLSPFFGFLFYDSPHSISHPKEFKGPCQPEWEYAKYQELNNNTNPTKFFNLYKNSLNFVDSLAGEILSDLKQKNLLKNTIVIITGDHGQEFNDNKKNYWGHNGNYSKAQLNTPLVIFNPTKKSAIYNHWTSHYDIIPSLMQDAFNTTNPINDYSIGKNISDTKQRDWLLVGSKDNFGIVERDRITSIYFNFNYDITSLNLDELEDAKLRTNLFNDIMKKANSFYYSK